MDNEKPVDISYKKLKPEAKTPKVRNNGNMFDIYAAEEFFIEPNEIAAVSTGLTFTFPDDMGLMFIPPSDLRSKASLWFPEGCKVIENSYYSKEEVKIYLQNTYTLKEGSKKVHEYKLIDGNVIAESQKLYTEGTVKICKGDCIACMLPVAAAYSNGDEITKRNVNTQKKQNDKDIITNCFLKKIIKD